MHRNNQKPFLSYPQWCILCTLHAGFLFSQRTSGQALGSGSRLSEPCLRLAFVPENDWLQYSLLICSQPSENSSLSNKQVTISM